MGSVRLWTRWTRTLSSVLSRNFNVGFSVSLFHKDASCIFPSEAGSGERTAGCGKDCAQDPQKDWSLGRIKNGVLKLPTKVGWMDLRLLNSQLSITKCLLQTLMIQKEVVSAYPSDVVHNPIICQTPFHEAFVAHFDRKCWKPRGDGFC